MGNSDAQGQFEFIDRGEPPATRRLSMADVLSFQVRPDQALLIGIGLLIGSTIVFAVGVERGKQLVRAERSLLARPAPLLPPAVAAGVPAATETEAAAVVAPNERAHTLEAPSEPPTRTPVRAAPTPASPRYAIQVVTYSQSQLARNELTRLQERGEPAFLVNRNGRTVLYVGPFPSKDDAREKLTSLKRRYHDCFLSLL